MASLNCYPETVRSSKSTQPLPSHSGRAMSEFKAPSDSPSANETTSSPAQAEREESQPEREESFDALLAQYERRHELAPETGGRQLQGTVIAVSADQVFLDIGFKVEGVLPVAALAGQQVKPGDRFRSRSRAAMRKAITSFPA